MKLPASSRLQFTQDMDICRVLNGMWQMSGYHGRINPKQAIQNMFDYMDAGYTTWDLADHYGPAEDLIGEFRRQLKDKRGESALNNIQAFTQNNIKLLCYGTLGGGLISEKYLNTKEPNSFQLNTASLKKYKNMINAWGSWELFQEMLTTLKEIATKHQVSIANVAVRYILEQPAVAGAIVGARLSISEHIQDNAKVFDFSLDETDYQKIDAVSSKARDLYQIIGDCGDEYRR